MKTNPSIGISRVAATAALVAALFITVSATAADTHGAKGGATKLTELKTVSDLQAVQPGDVVVMACPKCKTVTETRVSTQPKGAGVTETTAAVHQCPGCGAKWETDGHGKAKKEKVTHVCSHCGSKSAFCVVKKSAETK